MNYEQERMLDIVFQEYNKLKDEQIQRIGFRDNLLYVTLGVFGGVLAFALGKENSDFHGLLVLPWVSLILGWTYLINDEKITAIGKYIRHKLVARVHELAANSDIESVNADRESIRESIFAWEIAHRNDKRRKWRKIEQLLIDEMTFVFSGLAAILAFWYLVPQTNLAIQVLCIIEALLLVILGIEIFNYADLAKGR